MTSMPRQPPELTNPIPDSQPSNTNTPVNSTDRGKIAHFATKFREKYKRNHHNSSLKKLERKE